MGMLLCPLLWTAYWMLFGPLSYMLHYLIDNKQESRCADF